MVRFAALSVLVACTSQGAIDRGTPLPQCEECGPGAIRAGRLYSAFSPLVANRAGTVFGVTHGALTWLKDDFTLEESVPLPTESMPAEPRGIEIAIDDLGGGAVVRTPNGHDPSGWSDPKPVTALAPDHSAKWTVPIGALGVDGPVASSEMIVVSAFTGGLGSELRGLRASDGSLAWRTGLLPGPVYAFATDGTLVVATDRWEGVSGMHVAALDPATGDTRWVVQLDATDPKVPARIAELGVGPAGEIAVSWTLTTMTSSLALLDAGGTVRWTQPLDAPVTSVIADGDRAIASTFSAPSFSATSSAVAQYSASGVDWERQVTGGSVRLLALAEGRLIAAITSTDPMDPMASTTLGDVTYEGKGVAIVELAH